MENKSKRPIITIVILAIILLGIFGFSYSSSGKNILRDIMGNNQQNNEGSSNPSTNNEIQKITLSFKDYNYYPSTIRVKQGIPVEITLDSSIRGCFRSFNIQSLDVSEYSSSPLQTITFIPDKKGTFEFACGMHMGYGNIVVE